MTNRTDKTESGLARRNDRIVVAVDGSEGAEHALRWALAEAELRGVELEVVSVWEVPYAWAEGWNAAWAEDEAVLAERTAQETADFVDRVLDGKPRPPWVQVTALEGAPALCLLRHAEHAGLLVAGTRGRGGFSRLLLGSVSSALVHHAVCPVVVVPSPDSVEIPSD